MKNFETVEAVHTHTHTQSVLSKINLVKLIKMRISKTEDKGMKFAFICVSKKDRKQENCIGNEKLKVFEINAILI